VQEEYDSLSSGDNEQDERYGVITVEEEDIRPEEDIGLAETINVDEDVNTYEYDDPIHLKRTAPEEPDSDDSGTMF
jgi:hypothetical protein